MHERQQVADDVFRGRLGDQKAGLWRVHELCPRSVDGLLLGLEGSREPGYQRPHHLLVVSSCRPDLEIAP